ncbi:hypothetical protein [Microbacterium sp. gxy059]|uniref:hypothetical protein n=1 Tax=Microbacterium sp. gxy059 TaxID=2957199 RepID=UPI003D9733B7
MTAAHPLTDLPARGAASRSRILSVVRLQFINAQTFVWVPALVLAGAIICSLLIYAIIPTDGPIYGGGTQAPMWYFLVIGIQALTLSFPFSQAMSVTRREFHLGTLAAAALSAAGVATLVVLLAAIEQLTNGYGGIGFVAYLPWVYSNGWASAWLSFLVLTMFGFVVGFWFATIYKRWGSVVVTLVSLGVALLLIAALFVFTRFELWGDVVAWFAHTGPTGLTLYVIGLTALLAVGSYLTLRRAVP